MARKPRLRIAGIAQLITQYGINGQAVFFSDQDYQYYLDILNEAAIKESCQIHAFVLMSNKIHILATPNTPDGINQLMKTVGQRYVSYINNIEKRTGTIWDGRYKASLVESGDYLLTCMKYIEMTPVRLSVVKKPREYRFSSYLYNAQGIDVGVNITQHESYIKLSPWMDDVRDEEIQRNYKQLLKGQQSKKDLQDMEKVTNSNIIFGSRGFIELINNRV